MKCCCMAPFYFIASFAALHYGMVAFGFDLLTLPVIVQISWLPKAIMIAFGFSGLISLLSMFMPKCKGCGDKNGCCK